MMRISQTQLNLLKTCPRKYQHTYIDKLAAPPDPEKQEHSIFGSRFHLLMQQRELGLPIESILLQDDKLRQCFTFLYDDTSEIFQSKSDNNIFREAEHHRILNFQGYLLPVVYDLLIAEENQAQIIDWKTYPVPEKPEKLKKNWQTRLYPLVLVETTNYLPEHISMSYYFVQSQNNGEISRIKFNYNQVEHEKNQQDLKEILNQLSGWVQNYELGKDFPQIPENSRACNSCGFAMRCQRQFSKGENTLEEFDLTNIANIAEVSI